jgi:hypothetical protein
MQARLIRQAQSSGNAGTKNDNNNNNTRIDDDREEPDEEEEGDKPQQEATVQEFMNALTPESQQYNGRDIMQDIIQLIIAAPEATIINYL